MEKARDIDSKFAVSTDGKIYKKSNNEIIPDDEPLFLLRGRDELALELLAEYHFISQRNLCNDYHFKKLWETRNNFAQFRKNHPERMKMPSITEGQRFNIWTRRGAFYLLRKVLEKPMRHSIGRK